MNRNLLFLLLLLPSALSAQLTARPAQPGREVGFYEFLPEGYNPTGTYKYPLIINMHGAGEKGNGTTELNLVLQWSLGEMLRNNATLKFNYNGQQQAYIALFPQLDTSRKDWEAFYVDSMINYAVNNLNIDVNKIFLTGYSLGGGGSWMYPSVSLANANKIAGIIPVAPSPGYRGFDLCNIANGRVAVWAHHSVDDDAIDVQFTRDAIDGIKACSPVIPPLANFYAAGGHNQTWLWALDTQNIHQYPNMWEWMAGITRLNTPQNNVAPIANAGTDQTVVASLPETVLNGSASRDPNDVIVNYTWTKVSGPANYLIEKPNYPTTNLANLELGTYVFRLSVTDQFGIVISDDISVRVAATLPIGLSYFKGKNNGKVNQLSWATSFEENANHFKILRSTDGVSFTEIGSHPAGKRSYSFTDSKAAGGLTYYRLKNVDKDGSFTLSDIISITNSSPVVTLSRYPNPATDKLNIAIQSSVSGTLELSIHDMQGRTIKKMTINKPDFSWYGTIDLSTLSKGVHTIQVRKAGSLKETSSFVKE